jgi:hypothetical protein
MSKWIKQTVLRSTNGKQMHEEISYILWHKGNANQNYTEIPSHLNQNGNKENNQQLRVRLLRKSNPPTLLVWK